MQLLDFQTAKFEAFSKASKSKTWMHKNLELTLLKSEIQWKLYKGYEAIPRFKNIVSKSFKFIS